MASSTTIFPSTTTSAAPSASTTGSSGGNTSRPLLFFVALGFGVVFTNLWIIVGVKYCFRYNARARQAALHANGEPIDMGDMPRPRRRRDKKLMSIEEVNERFPLTKYKQWRASRESRGLPVEGGVTAPPSGAVSIKDAPGLAMEVTVDASETAREESIATDTSTLPPPPLPSRSSKAIGPEDRGSSEAHDFAEITSVRKSHDHPRHSSDKKSPLVTTQAVHEVTKEDQQSTTTTQNDKNDDVDEDDDFDPIQTAIPTELLNAPGDACAICLDNLDDDDDIRGLACGHAFHAGCLDPWLTSRRACCPLCKADYYVPKPRADGEPDESNRRHAHQHAAQSSAGIWLPGGGRRAASSHTILLPPRLRWLADRRAHEAAQRSQPANTEQMAMSPPTQPTDSTTTEQTDTRSRFGQWLGRTPILPNLRLNHRRMPSRPNPTSNSPAPPAPVPTTPSQLEAGTGQ